MNQKSKIVICVMFIGCLVALRLYAASTVGTAFCTTDHVRPGTEGLRFAPTNGQTVAMVYTTALNRISGYVLRTESGGGTNNIPATFFVTTTSGNILTITPTAAVTNATKIDVIAFE